MNCRVPVLVPTCDLCAQLLEVEAVVFDDGVGEEFVAHLADLVGGVGFGVGLEGDFHVLAGADAGYAVEAELEESAADGLALGVADGGARLDIDFGEVHCTPADGLTWMGRMKGTLPSP